MFCLVVNKTKSSLWLFQVRLRFLNSLGVITASRSDRLINLTIVVVEAGLSLIHFQIDDPPP